MTLESDAFVFFGATGDLAFRQIFPAVQALIRRGHFEMPIIGVAKSAMDLDALRARARESLEQHGGVDPRAFATLAAHLQYVNGDYHDPDTFRRLRTALGGATRPLYYFAIPPDLFATVAEGLAGSDNHHGARVVVEKPFGRDLASAQALNRTLHRSFREHAIFRIDHYLGKEPVQNLVYFRFANSFLAPVWNRQYIASVQLTMAENVGVEGRGRFYEEVGAIRDVVQNHLLEVVALLTMEAPVGHHPDALRDEKQRAFRAMGPLANTDVVRGQFRGYRSEDGVAADSRVETFAAVRLSIDTPRWAECRSTSARASACRLRRPKYGWNSSPRRKPSSTRCRHAKRITFASASARTLRSRWARGSNCPEKPWSARPSSCSCATWPAMK